jgi:hypothetical protein
MLHPLIVAAKAQAFAAKVALTPNPLLAIARAAKADGEAFQAAYDVAAAAIWAEGLPAAQEAEKGLAEAIAAYDAFQAGRTICTLADMDRGQHQNRKAAEYWARVVTGRTRVTAGPQKRLIPRKDQVRSVAYIETSEPWEGRYSGIRPACLEGPSSSAIMVERASDEPYKVSFDAADTRNLWRAKRQWRTNKVELWKYLRVVSRVRLGQLQIKLRTQRLGLPPTLRS